MVDSDRGGKFFVDVLVLVSKAMQGCAWSFYRYALSHISEIKKRVIGSGNRGPLSSAVDRALSLRITFLLAARTGTR